MKVYLESLGCARNQVDSEGMLGDLIAAGAIVAEQPHEADVIIVNTCAFIEPAVNETIDVILELARFKKIGVCRRLIAIGCFPERFGQEMTSKMPEVDIFLGAGAYDQIKDAVFDDADLPTCFLPDPQLSQRHKKISPRRLTDKQTAYLRVAEGCDRHCTYCIIPKLRGKQRSRPLDEILDEARFLRSSGVKEINLVAQETTAYGQDIDGKNRFAELISSVAQVADGAWVRFLYGHPESLSADAIRAMAAQPNVCAYFDLPIQHAGDSILKKMARGYRRDDLLKLFAFIREQIPNAVLRTTVIVGFPGETERDFQIIAEFIKEIQFDHAGVFTYSDFDDLPSHRLENHVPLNVAQDRRDRLMNLQKTISLNKNQKYLDTVVKTLIEKKVEDGIWQGRGFFQAPEVDGVIYVHGDHLAIGDFADVKIIDAMEYDLVGDVV